MNRLFPKGFLWGAATAAHQVEGGLTDDWTVWETANAERLAGEAASHFASVSPVWPDIAAEANNPANYRSSKAAQHYRQFADDVKLMKALHLSAYRFTIPWSRIEPREGERDTRALARYAAWVRTLKEQGIEPFPTLWHWPLPTWLAQRGGWLAPDAVDRFKNFVARVVEQLHPNVTNWLTLNEPNVYAAHGYLTGQWPPHHRSLVAYLRVARRLQEAHRAAHAVIKTVDPSAQVGIAHHVTHFESNRNPINLTLKAIANYYWNWSYLDPIADQLDFIGVNNYFRNTVNLGFNKNLDGRRSDLGWELYPPSLAGAVEVTWQRYRKPIVVTEHGLADRADTERQWFIEESLRHLHCSIEKGADVRGYLHWSLLDNFEWDKGFWPRFGLIEVDYKTMKRTIRPSARHYTQIAKTNGLK